VKIKKGEIFTNTSSAENFFSQTRTEYAIGSALNNPTVVRFAGLN
jgi:hypothetical protein